MHTNRDGKFLIVILSSAVCEEDPQTVFLGFIRELIHQSAIAAENEFVWLFSVYFFSLICDLQLFLISHSLWDKSLFLNNLTPVAAAAG